MIVNVKNRHKKGVDIPDANEVNVNVDRESFLECDALPPSRLIFPRIHLVCKWHLLMVTLWKQSHLQINSC